MLLCRVDWPSAKGVTPIGVSPPKAVCLSDLLYSERSRLTPATLKKASAFALSSPGRGWAGPASRCRASDASTGGGRRAASESPPLAVACMRACSEAATAAEGREAAWGPR